VDGAASDASLNVIGTTVGAPVLTVTAATGQTGNLQEWKNSGGTVLSSVSSTGTINLKAGADAANGAPLKFTSGTNLTTPEDGAVEYDGTDFFVTNNTARYTLAKTLTGTGTLDFPSTSAQNSSDLTISVTGAAVGDVVALGIPNASTNNHSTFTAWVSAADNVTVRFNNYSAAAIDPASDTFRVSVIKY
ncbi:unnamed protein product, partial [marine sediment metagenome]